MISIYNYVPEKRADLLIESFKQIETDKKLVIAGGISDSEDYFKELKRKAADDERIIFTDFVEGEKRKNYIAMRMCMCFLLTWKVCRFAF